MGRGRHCKQILLACVGSVHSVRTTLDLPKLKVACVSWVYTAQAASCSAGELSKADAVFHALPRSELLRFRFRVLHKGTDLVGCAFCALPLCLQRVRGRSAASQLSFGDCSVLCSVSGPGCTLG